MRVLIDTNIIFSTLLFPRSVSAAALMKATMDHEIVICDKSITELFDILERKAPSFLPDAEAFIEEFRYELVPAVESSVIFIRDAKDQPILNAAITYDVDVVLTGDKDFLTLKMEKPKCVTASEFLKLY